MSEPSNNDPLRRFLRQVSERSLWQVLGVYVVSGWLVFEVVQSLTEGLGLPSWFPAFAFVVLLLGLPMVLATAFIQHGASGAGSALRPGAPIDEVYPSSAGGATPTRERLFTWKNTALGGAGALLALIAVGLLGGTPGSSGPDAAPLPTTPAVAGAADVIAVLPFRTAGPDLEDLEEGLMDLLARGLAQADVIATIDPRTVMKGIRGISPDGEIDVAQALSLADALGATSVLLGSAVAAGDEVRLDAVLHRADGDSVVTAQATGSPDDILALTDELAVSLVRALWRSSAPIPNLDAGAVTTRSPEALRAFLEGERRYRLGDLSGARTALIEAVQIDSTFALAHHRLGWVRAWTEGVNAETTVRQLRAAWRFGDRLPPRERTLVEGFLMLTEDRLDEGYARLRPYVSRWSDDPEAWILVANYQFHHPEWMGRSRDEVLEPFDRVIALDSALAMAYEHPLQIALHNRDKSLYDRYMQPLIRRMPNLSDYARWARIVQRAEVCFGDPDVAPLPESEWLRGEPRQAPPCASGP